MGVIVILTTSVVDGSFRPLSFLAYRFATSLGLKPAPLSRVQSRSSGVSVQSVPANGFSACTKALA